VGAAQSETASAVAITLAQLAAAHAASLPPKRNPERKAVEDPVIEIARHRFIVFRQAFPPPDDPGLSFYGGAPVGPEDMDWPCAEDDGKPLTFVMQWECSALAAQDATGLLPSDGALYLFSNFGFGKSLEFRFIHAGGDGRDWATLPEPSGLPPIFGKEDGAQSLLGPPHVPAERRDVPRLLPRWPFAPVGVDYTKSMEGDESNGEGRRFWTDGPELGEALLRAQDPRRTPTADKSSQWGFERPFPAFPHDWAAVRVVAAAALRELDYVSDPKWQRFMPEADAAARAAQTAAWRQEALTLYDEAVTYPAGAAVAQDRADALWSRIARFEPLFWPGFAHIVDEAVNLSFGLDSAGRAAIPAAFVEACAQRHRLAILSLRDERAHEFKRERGLDLPEKEVFALYEQAKAAGALKRVRDVWAPPPNRMFGPPRYVQGDVEEYVDDWLLLLELGNSDSIGWNIGDGVLQFLIRPEDLRARRFDRVEAIRTGY
jgi:hypothetical protein